jgi:hypothetical protein
MRWIRWMLFPCSLHLTDIVCWILRLTCLCMSKYCFAPFLRLNNMNGKKAVIGRLEISLWESLRLQESSVCKLRGAFRASCASATSEATEATRFQRMKQKFNINIIQGHEHQLSKCACDCMRNGWLCTEGCCCSTALICWPALWKETANIAKSFSVGSAAAVQSNYCTQQELSSHLFSNSLILSYSVLCQELSHLHSQRFACWYISYWIWCPGISSFHAFPWCNDNAGVKRMKHNATMHHSVTCDTHDISLSALGRSTVPGKGLARIYWRWLAINSFGVLFWWQILALSAYLHVSIWYESTTKRPHPGTRQLLKHASELHLEPRHFHAVATTCSTWWKDLKSTKHFETRLRFQVAWCQVQVGSHLQWKARHCFAHGM